MSTNASAGSWQSLPTPLTSWILDVIQAMGYTHMTPVQAATIPLFMKHKDVVVEAVTGSGKTLAFVIPILERLTRREHRLAQNQVGALVISPTRELATQIHSVFSLFLASRSSPGHDPAAENNLSELASPLLLVSSDSSPAEDVKNFLATGSDIIIGTPGRIEEFLLGKGLNIVNVKELDVLVLDEADRLLDLGFQNTLTRIITHLPKQRRTGLFSATMTDADALSELVRVGLRNPARVVVKVQSKKNANGQTDGSKLGEVIQERRIPANLKNYFLTCRSSEKLVQMGRLVINEASHHQASRFIVYFATCACVDYFYRILPPFLPLNATLHSLHGHLPPAARTKALTAFTMSPATFSSPVILLATDVAARGLDIPDVDVVIQFDAPADPKAFSHRCGRTARAGKSGKAIVLLTEEETDYVDFMAVRRIPITRYPDVLSCNSTRVVSDDVRISINLTVDDALSRIRTFILEDRSLHDKAAKAYVSFVRAYSKHEASYIFRLKNLDLVGVAESFGLLRLPKMPELKDVNRDDWEDADVDWDTYAYTDKAQERKRLRAMENSAEKALEREQRRTERRTRDQTHAAWSNKATKRDEREKRRQKKDKKRQWLKAQKQEKSGEGDSRCLKRSRCDEMHDDGDEWAQLAREERMAKKVRKGGITQMAFDNEFMS